MAEATVVSGFDRDTCGRWRKFGTEKGFSNDTEIARFLLDEYENSQSLVQSTFCCAGCQTPLSPFCTSCHQQVQHDSSQQPGTLEIVGTVSPSSPKRSCLVSHGSANISDVGNSPIAHCTVFSCIGDSSEKKIICDQPDEFSLNVAVIDHSYSEVLSFKASEFGTNEENKKLSKPENTLEDEADSSNPSPPVRRSGRRLHAAARQDSICRACDRKCSDSQALKEHIKTHIDDSDGYLYCEECGEQFSYLSAYKRHILSHSNKRPFICDICGVSFCVPSYLRDHKRRIHDRPFKCSQCEAAFGDRFSFQKHLTKKHSPESRKNADEDIHEQTQISSFNGYAQTQTKSTLCLLGGTLESGVENAEADLQANAKNTKSSSGSTVPRKARQSSYAKTLARPVFSAPTPRYFGDNAQNLNKHKHSLKNSFWCDLCNKSFSRLVFLKYHKCQHTDTNLYRCSQCNLDFLSFSQLNMHNVQIHSAMQFYTCGDCDQRFTELSQFESHQQEHGHTQIIFSEDSCEFTRKKGGKLAPIRVKGNAEGQKDNSKDLSETATKVRNSSGVTVIPCATRSHINRSYVTRSRMCAKSFLVCDKCGHKFSHRSSLALHMAIHTDEKPFICDVCDMKFRRKYQLQDHKANKHSGKRPYMCDFCGLTYSQRSALRKHLLSHSETRPYGCDQCEKAYKDPDCLRVHKRWAHKPVCQLCGITFPSRAALKEHMSVHGGEKPFACDECDKTFCRPSNLKIHKKIHGNDRPYKCSHCGAGFFSQQKLAYHIRKHTGEKEVCDQCGKVFAQPDSLRKHYKTKHATDKSKAPTLHQCGDCGAVLHSAFRLKTHKLKHTGAYPHVCDYCSRGFALPYDLKKHLLTHGPRKNIEKPHKCELCGASFQTVEKLTVHTMIHNGLYQFSCDVCGLGLSTRGCLRQHMKIHTREKLFACDICGATFIQKGNLMVHRRKHTGERPYKCTQCEHGFQTSSALRRHFRKHTGEKPYTCEICGRTFSDYSTWKKHKARPHVQGTTQGESVLAAHETSVPAAETILVFTTHLAV